MLLGDNIIYEQKSGENSEEKSGSTIVFYLCFLYIENH